MQNNQTIEPSKRETRAHLALAAVIWVVLYQFTPKQFIETDGPAGVITMFVLALAALAISIILWMSSPPAVRSAMLILPWIVPIGFLAWAFTAKQARERDRQEEDRRVRSSAGAVPAASASAELAVSPSTDLSSSMVPADLDLPNIDQMVSNPLPDVIKNEELLIIMYEREDGTRSRTPMRLFPSWTPDTVVELVQARFDGLDIPLVATLASSSGLRIARAERAAPGDRWMIASKRVAGGVGFPTAPRDW